MRSPALWNRRQLLQGAATLALTAPLRAVPVASRPRFAYVGSDEGNIHVFRVGGSRWTPLQQVSCPRPASLAFHPSGKLLYAVNEIDHYDGLPRGSVESLRIDPRDGTLRPLDRQPLSLSGTLPRHLALSPDGHHLVVAVYGGGACNVIPLARDGSLGRVSGIVKQTGAGPHPERQRTAHPHTILFDPASRSLFASDLGADRLSLFTLAEGRLVLAGTTPVAAGSGPGQMALHASGQLLFVANHLRSSVTTFALNRSADPCLTLLHTTQLGKEGAACSLLLHTSDDLLYTCVSDEAMRSTTVTAWRIDPRTGALTGIDRVDLPSTALHLAQDAPADTGLHLLDATGGGILHLPFSRVGHFGTSQRIAAVPSPRSLVLL